MYFRNSQNFPSTPDTDEVDTPETAPDASAGMVSPQGIITGAMPTTASMSTAFLSGTRILMFFKPSTSATLTLRCRYCVGQGTMSRIFWLLRAATFSYSGRTYL